MTSRLLSGPQGQLHVVEDGTSKKIPVLFLHADAGNITQWEQAMKGLAAKRRVAGFDFRGHAASEPAVSGDYSFAGRSEDVAAVAKALGWERFIIVAHSGGGAVALTYASTHPANVAGILLVDPPTDPRAMPAETRQGYLAAIAKGPANAVIKQFYGSIAGNNERTKARVLADVDRVTDAALVGVAEELPKWNPEAALKGVRSSIEIIVTPANDNPAALYRLRSDIPHRVISPAGHWVQLDQPQAVLEAIERFANSVQ